MSEMKKISNNGSSVYFSLLKNIWVIFVEIILELPDSSVKHINPFI